MTPKNIVISHVYSSDNKGDAALTSVLIDDLRRTYPEATLTILRLESVVPGSVFEGVPEEPSFMSHAVNRFNNPLAKLAYTVYMLGATTGAAWLRAKGARLPLPAHLQKTADIYNQADLIVPVGGGYIRSRKGLMHRWNVPLLLHPLLIGAILKKPTVLYAQSVGPFQNRLEERMVAAALRRMTLILLREDTSVALLAKLGVRNNVRRAVDSGFLLQSKGSANLRKLYGIPAKKLLVGVTVRKWLSGEAQERYEAAVATALDNLVNDSQAHVIFIPQVTANKGDDDRVASRRVLELMRHKKDATLVEDTPDHHTIKAMYDELDMLLGTRFHSVIFSLTSFVPVVAIEYEHKTSGIMRDLELDEWVIKIEDVTAPKLTKLLKKLVAERAAYQAHLQKRIPPYVQRARQTAVMLAEAYRSR